LTVLADTAENMLKVHTLAHKRYTNHVDITCYNDTFQKNNIPIDDSETKHKNLR